MRKLKNEELGRLSNEQFKAAQKKPFCLVLDNVRSLNNVGAAFRTGDAFLIEKVYLCGITGKPPHRDIQKTALGATDAVDWEHHEDIHLLMDELKKQGWTLVALEQADESISLLDFSPKPSEKYAFIFGNEAFGVQEDVVSSSDYCVEIPQYGTKHSLNIAVSIGVVLWDMFAKSVKLHE